VEDLSFISRRMQDFKCVYTELTYDQQLDIIKDALRMLPGERDISNYLMLEVENIKVYRLPDLEVIIV